MNSVWEMKRGLPQLRGAEGPVLHVLSQFINEGEEKEKIQAARTVEDSDSSVCECRTSRGPRMHVLFLLTDQGTSRTGSDIRRDGRDPLEHHARHGNAGKSSCSLQTEGDREGTNLYREAPPRKSHLEPLKTGVGEEKTPSFSTLGRAGISQRRFLNHPAPLLPVLKIRVITPELQGRGQDWR